VNAASEGPDTSGGVDATTTSAADVLGDLAALEHCVRGLDLKVPDVPRLCAAVLFNLECARFDATRDLTADGVRDDGGTTTMDGGGSALHHHYHHHHRVVASRSPSLGHGLDDLPAVHAARVILLRAAMRLSRAARPVAEDARRLAAALWEDLSLRVVASDAVFESDDGDDGTDNPPREAPLPWLATVFEVGESAGECEAHKRLLLARCCHAAGEHGQAWEHLALIPSHTSAARLAATLRADLCLRRGDPGGALDVVLDALPSQTDGCARAVLLNLAGCCHTHLGNPAAAVVSFCAALREHPKRMYAIAAYNCAAVRPTAAVCDETTVRDTAAAAERQNASAELHAVEALAEVIEQSGASFSALAGTTPSLSSSPFWFHADAAADPVTVLSASPHLAAARSVLVADPTGAGEAVIEAAREEAEAILLRRAALLALRCSDPTRAEALLSRFFAAAEARWVHAASGATRSDSELLLQCAAAKLRLGKAEVCAAICRHVVDAGCVNAETWLISAAAACQQGEWADALTSLDNARTAVGSADVRQSRTVACWMAVARARCAVNGHGEVAEATAMLRAAAVRCPTDAACMQHFCHLLRHRGGNAAEDEAAVNWHAFCADDGGRCGGGGGKLRLTSLC